MPQEGCEELKQAVFRVDAASFMGVGHLMRCLSLADYFADRGWECHFLTRVFNYDSTTTIVSRGHRAVRMAAPKSYTFDAFSSWLGVPWLSDVEETSSLLRTIGGDSLLVVDHYAIDEKWETLIRAQCHTLCVIDDLANRRHDCQVLIDQNEYLGLETRYNDLVSRDCRKLLGARYALLSRGYSGLSSIRDFGAPLTVFVFFGGIDRKGITLKAVRALKKIGKEQIGCCHIVQSRQSDSHNELKVELSTDERFVLHARVDTLADIMLDCDFAIAAAGTNSWERLCTGLPTLIATVSANQVPLAESLHKKHLAIYLGDADGLSEPVLRQWIETFIEDHGRLTAMSVRGTNLVDGKGCERTFSVLTGKRKLN